MATDEGRTRARQPRSDPLDDDMPGADPVRAIEDSERRALVRREIEHLEGMVRAMTDILWTGSRRIRTWRGGDVRAVYYGVLAAVVVWGVVALRMAQPIVLLQLAANVGGVVFVVASLHLLYINTRLLPRELRPPLWRRAALVGMALFSAFFVTLSLGSLR